MRDIIGILIIILCQLMLSCNKQKDESSNEDSIAIYKKSDLHCHFKYRSTIKLDESNVKIGKASLYYASKEKFIIADYQNNIYFQFDSSGKFDRIIGKKGRGPGEYNSLMFGKMTVDSDGNIYVYDDGKAALIIYNAANQFLKELSYDFGHQNFQISFNTHHPLISLRNFRSKEYWKNVDFFHILDDSLKIMETIKIDYPQIFTDLDLGNFQYTSWKNDDDFIYMTFQPLPYIYKYNYSGELVARIGRMPDKFNLIDVDIMKKSGSSKETMMYMAKASTSQHLFLFEKKYLFFSYTTIYPEKNLTYDDLFAGRYKSFSESLLYTIDGQEIDVDMSNINGEEGKRFIYYIDPQGIAYSMINEPNNREIRTYEIIIELKK